MWDEVPIEDALEALVDHRGRTPKKLGAEFVSTGVQVISAQNITENRLDLDATSRFVDPSVADRWMKLPLQPGDVLLSSEAPLGCVAVVAREHGRLCLGQRLFALRGRPGVLDGGYLAAALKVDPVRGRLLARATGTTAQGIKQAELRKVLLPLPPLPEQRAIADVLGALDNKIESNGRAADLLESIVRLAHERAVTSAITWEPLAALGSVSGGGTPSSKVPDYWDPSEVPWITPRDMTALGGSPVVWAGQRAISPAGLAASSARLLEAGTVLYTSRATLGLVAIAQQPLATNQGFISITPTPPFSSAFVYATLRARTEHINAKANGSTFQEVNKTNFKTVRFARPSNDVLREFDVVATSALRLVAGLVREASDLRKIRDALLPKLVSGQIPVPFSDDVEEKVGAATEALA